MYTMLGSAARTESGSQDFVAPPHSSATFVLDVTSAATSALDTLDVVVQTTYDGSNWFDVVSFTTVLGNGGAKSYVGKIAAELSESMFNADTSLSSGQVRNVVSRTYRVSWTVVDNLTDNASFTFSVTGLFA